MDGRFSFMRGMGEEMRGELLIKWCEEWGDGGMGDFQEFAEMKC